MLTDTDQKLQDIFFPYISHAQKRVRSEGRRFVHYTSAAVAVNILREGRIWMRKTSTMNDFMEVEHGYNCVVKAIGSDAGRKFLGTLDQIGEGLHRTLLQQVDAWMPSIRFDTFITCLSEHDDDEDRYGRLSMWRAYGGNDTGVALVLNQNVLLAPTDALGAYTAPVAYFTDAQTVAYLETIASQAQANLPFLKSITPDLLMRVLVNALRYAIIAVKHPGFREEREWRIVYAPAMTTQRRILITPEIIRGTPQMVAKIPLVDIPEEGLKGATIPELIDRIIIGPTQYPAAVHECFHRMLVDAGVKNVNEKIVISDIPLRR